MPCSWPRSSRRSKPSSSGRNKTARTASGPRPSGSSTRTRWPGPACSTYGLPAATGSGRVRRRAGRPRRGAARQAQRGHPVVLPGRRTRRSRRPGAQPALAGLGVRPMTWPRGSGWRSPAACTQPSSAPAPRWARCGRVRSVRQPPSTPSGWRPRCSPWRRRAGRPRAGSAAWTRRPWFSTRSGSGRPATHTVPSAAGHHVRGIPGRGRPGGQSAGPAHR